MAWFKERGLGAIGVEGWEKPIREAVTSGIILHDYTTGPMRTGIEWDLCWCAEFVEHVEERFWENILATFLECRIVTMTHAAPRQRGWHHVNCRPEPYWIGKMAGHFDYDPVATKDLRAKGKEKSAFRERGLIFIHKDKA